MVQSTSSDEILGEIASPTTMHEGSQSPSQSKDALFMGGSITKRGTSIASIVFLLLALFIIPCYAHDYETSSGRILSGEEGEGR